MPDKSVDTLLSGSTAKCCFYWGDKASTLKAPAIHSSCIRYSIPADSDVTPHYSHGYRGSMRCCCRNHVAYSPRWITDNVD